jgi:hypothetical protein
VATYRRRPILIALAGLVLAWAFAVGGYVLFKNSKVTAEKVADYLQSMDLRALAGEARAKALKDLARKMNALPVEERRRARLEGEWARWFQNMTEEEKSGFLEATLPSGFKQMLTSFEQLPEERRRQAIDRAMRDLARARAEMESETPGRVQGTDTNRPGELSPELQQRVVTIGLKSFYGESSAQTKAELAPLLEEMQRLMETGMLFRGRR